MLALSRHTGERLVIADGQIIVQVVEIYGDRVVLGIEAPKHIRGHREEVHQRIIEEELPKVRRIRERD